MCRSRLLPALRAHLRRLRGGLLLVGLAAVGFFGVNSIVPNRSDEPRWVVSGILPLSGDLSRKANEQVRAAILAIESYLKHAQTRQQSQGGPTVRLQIFDQSTGMDHVQRAFAECVPNVNCHHIATLAYHDSASLVRGIIRDLRKLPIPPNHPFIVSAATKSNLPKSTLRILRYAPTNRIIAAGMVSRRSSGQTVTAILRSDSAYGRDLGKELGSLLKIPVKSWQRVDPCRLSGDVYFAGEHSEASKFLTQLAQRCLLAAQPPTFTLIGSDALCTHEFIHAVTSLHAATLSIVAVSLVPAHQSELRADWRRYSRQYKQRFGERPEGPGFGTYRALLDLLRQEAPQEDSNGDQTAERFDAPSVRRCALTPDMSKRAVSNTSR